MAESTIGNSSAATKAEIVALGLFDSVTKTPGTGRSSKISPDTSVVNRNPADSGWTISAGYSVFGGEDGITKFVDPVISLGYNVKFSNGQENTALHSLGLYIEADYWDTLKQNSEVYFSYYRAVGGSTRPIFFQIANSAYGPFAIGDISGSFIKADITNGFYINNGAYGEGTGGNGDPLAHFAKLGVDFYLYTTGQTYTVSFGRDSLSGNPRGGVTSGGTIFDLYGPSGSKFRLQQTSVAGYCGILVDSVTAAYLVHGAYGYPANAAIWQVGGNDNLDDVGGNGVASQFYILGASLPAGSKTFHANAGRSSTNDVGRFTAWNGGVAITSITKGATTVVGVASHTLHVGGRVRFDNAVGGMTQIRMATGLITAQTPTSITVDIDSTAYSNWTSGGTINGEGMVAISARGGIRLRDAVAVPATPAASEIEMWWDETANVLKYKTAAGTVKTITAT